MVVTARKNTSIAFPSFHGNKPCCGSLAFPRHRSRIPRLEARTPWRASPTGSAPFSRPGRARSCAAPSTPISLSCQFAPIQLLLPLLLPFHYALEVLLLFPNLCVDGLEEAQLAGYRGCLGSSPDRTPPPLAPLRGALARLLLSLLLVTLRFQVRFASFASNDSVSVLFYHLGLRAFCLSLVHVTRQAIRVTSGTPGLRAATASLPSLRITFVWVILRRAPRLSRESGQWVGPAEALAPARRRWRLGGGLCARCCPGE